MQSAVLAALVSLMGFLLGWPAGVLCGLFQYRMRGVTLVILALPLLMPPILWAIGISMLRTRLGLQDGLPFSGLAGCVWAQSGLAVSLAGFAALLSVRGITRSQADAAMLGGGHSLLWQLSLRSALPASLSASTLGGMMALSDAGPGLLTGWRTTAAEILDAFSARYDFAESMRLSLWLALVAMALAVPMILHGASALDTAIAARDPNRAWHRTTSRSVGVAGSILAGVLACVVLLPLLALVLPLIGNTPLARAWQEVSRTASNTAIYGLGTGVLAMLLAWPLVRWTGWDAQRRRIMLSIMLALLALPSMLPAIGWIYLANTTPPSLDMLFRERLGVCIVLACRVLPVAFVILLRRWTAFSPSWNRAAAVHGVPRWTFFRRVMLPHQAPGFCLAILLGALLACGEINITLLLHPPGETSLPLAIFTIMANAPDALVAALCLLYVALVLPATLLVFQIGERQ